MLYEIITVKRLTDTYEIILRQYAQKNAIVRQYAS